ncbi:MAG: TatD family hydrolase [Pseudomonadota bacterium]
MLVDSHCHLDFADFNDDRAAIIQNALDSDVKYMQTICTKIDEFSNILSIAKQYDFIYCSVGIHPNEVANQQKITADEIVKLSEDPKVIGIGETGLDYHYEYSPKELQQESFKEHIKAAQITGLPVIVHTRNADEDTIDILQKAMDDKPFKGLIHCFSSSKWLAEKAIEMGLYISISGIVTFKNAVDLQNAIKELPLDRLLVETDAPYLAPVPKRGKRNEPAYTKHTAKYLADLQEVSYEQVADITTENFFKLFSKAKR